MQSILPTNGLYSPFYKLNLTIYIYIIITRTPIILPMLINNNINIIGHIAIAYDVRDTYCLYISNSSPYLNLIKYAIKKNESSSQQ